MSYIPTGKTYVGSDELYEEVQRTMQLAVYMNTGWRPEAEVRDFTPLNINYGPGVRFGHDCFLNFGCTMLALGGITIEDAVFIGPHCVLATEYHPEDPATRRGHHRGQLGSGFRHPSLRYCCWQPLPGGQNAF